MTNKQLPKTILLIDEGLSEFKNGGKGTLAGILGALNRLVPDYKILPVSSKQDYDALRKNQENIQGLYMVFMSANTEDLGGTMELMGQFSPEVKIVPLDYIGNAAMYVKAIASGIKVSQGETLEIITLE